MKVVLTIVLSVVIIGVLAIGGGLFYISRGLQTGANLEIDDVNLSSVDDGTYTGKYIGGRWTNEVSVTVKEHRITEVDILKDVLIPKPGIAEEIISKVIEEQRADVDVVSGATVTCKAYLKSIENALKK